MSHTVTTDADGMPTFSCSEPANATCRFWADCWDDGGCAVGGDCSHAKVQHDHCIYSEWYARPDDTIAMYVDEHGDDGGPLPVNMPPTPIDVEWDECPLWSFLPVHPNGGQDA